MNWIINNWLEIFGTLTGFVYIYLSIKENILLWPVGLVSCFVYIFVFYDSKFYADMTLQIYYVIISAYGWYNWKHERIVKNKKLEITKMPINKWIVLILLSVTLFVIIGFSLDKFTDTTIPYGDAFTTTLGIIATWMLTKKYIEQWLIWIIADFVAILLYIYKGLYPTTILYFVFAVMAIVGYKEWKKSMLNDKKQ